MAHILGPQNGAKLAALVGAVGGLVFVLVNAGAAGGPWPLVLRVVGVVVFVVTLVLVLRAPPLPLDQHRTRGQMRAYGWIVLAEVVAIPVGASVLTNVLGIDGAALPWVVIVLGVHFLGFERVFPGAAFVVLGVALTTLGVATLVLAVLEADPDLVIVVSGVVTGFLLLGWSLSRVARGLGTPPSASRSTT